MSTAERLARALESLHASLKAYHYGRMPEAVQRAYDNAATEIAAYRSTPADGGGQGVTPLTEQPLNGRCQADRDGDCVHSQCPQLRDGEPDATGRHCPLDGDDDHA